MKWLILILFITLVSCQHKTYRGTILNFNPKTVQDLQDYDFRNAAEAGEADILYTKETGDTTVQCFVSDHQVKGIAFHFAINKNGADKLLAFLATTGTITNEEADKEQSIYTNTATGNSYQVLKEGTAITLVAHIAVNDKK